MDLNRRSDIILLGFILFSLLLHLLFIYLWPQRLTTLEKPEPKPVYIDLRPSRPLDRELDVPRRSEPAKSRTTPARRLGAENREVKKETAPKGKDFEDLAPRARPAAKAASPTPTPAVKPVKPTPPTEKPTPKTGKPSPRTPAEVEPWRRPGDEGPASAAQPAAPAAPTTERVPPSLAQLKNLDLLGSAKTAAASVTDQWRRKYRADVEEGDTVWLDMEEDILISFFKRFRDNIYMVWNYPARARELGQTGTCLLRITISRDGTVKNVILKETSGYPILDNEATRAVRKGAPYGPLPTAFPKDELNIMVFFHYDFNNRPALY